MPNIYFVGVDVGTGSTRAAVVNSKGEVLESYVKEIKTWKPKPNHYEQSSDNIWEAVCECVQVILLKLNCVISLYICFICFFF